MGLEMFAGPAGPAGRLHRPAPPRNRPARPSVPELPPRDGPATAPGCPVCAAALHGRGDRRYRSAACRQAAHRRRRIALPAPVRLPGRSRGEHTVYECAECGQRLVGEQWCPTANACVGASDTRRTVPSCGEPDRRRQHPEPPMH
jgi:hypothetical protein